MTFLASLLYLEQCLFLPLEHTTCLPFHPSSFLHPLILHPYPFLLSFFFLLSDADGRTGCTLLSFPIYFYKKPFFIQRWHSLSFLFFFCLIGNMHAILSTVAQTGSLTSRDILPFQLPLSPPPIFLFLPSHPPRHCLVSLMPRTAHFDTDCYQEQ